MSIDVRCLLRKLRRENQSPGKAGPWGHSLPLLPQLASGALMGVGGSQASASAPTELKQKAPPASHSQAGLHSDGWWTLLGPRKSGSVDEAEVPRWKRNIAPRLSASLCSSRGRPRTGEFELALQALQALKSELKDALVLPRASPHEHLRAPSDGPLGSGPMIQNHAQ